MYKLKEIADKVYYVGVNDRQKVLFENMWPLPYGVSYNSYLIIDEKTVLVDTVDVCYSDVFLKKIEDAFSSLEIYDCEIPNISATSFCVFSSPSSELKPNLKSTIILSRSGSWFIAFLSILHSTSVSISLYIISSSVPIMSDNRSSLPSQSTLSGSSIDTSAFILLFLLRYIRISFSIHLDAYVASLIFLSLSYELIALISPIVPIDIKSSTPTPVLSNFFAI